MPSCAGVNEKASSASSPKTNSISSFSSSVSVGSANLSSASSVFSVSYRLIRFAVSPNASPRIRSGTLSIYPLLCSSETTWIARMESPPNEKKLSSMPTCSIPSVSLMTAASAFSSSLSAGRYSCTSNTISPTGSAFRSSFPDTVVGNASMCTNTDGIICGGSVRLNALRSSVPVYSLPV